MQKLYRLRYTLIYSSSREYQPATAKKKKAGRKPFFIFFVVVLGLGIVAALIIGLVLGEGGDDDPLLGDYTYDHAAVAADHQTCSTIGK